MRTDDVWEHRYYETTPEGQCCRRSKIIGTLGQYPNFGRRSQYVSRTSPVHPQPDLLNFFCNLSFAVSVFPSQGDLFLWAICSAILPTDCVHL